MNSDMKKTPRCFRMTDKAMKLLAEFAESKGLTNTAALEMIIREAHQRYKEKK